MQSVPHRNDVESGGLRPFIPFHWLPMVRFMAVILWLQLLCRINIKKKKENSKGDVWSDLVSSGTLLLRTQLSCSWTDSGVVGPSPVPGVGAWMGLRPPLRVFLFRLLADWWDKDWWLCGGGRGGRSVDWLWWLAAPAGKQTKTLLLVGPFVLMKEILLNKRNEYN